MLAKRPHMYVTIRVNVQFFSFILLCMRDMKIIRRKEMDAQEPRELEETGT